MTRHFDADYLVPLRTDALIEERVRDIIGRARCRQMWLLFLDVHQIQLPLLIPIESLPNLPEGEGTAQVVDNIAELMGEIEASELVVVWERDGPAAVSAQDAAWAWSIVCACRDSGVPLRASLLAHRGGVRWLAADDYLHAVAP
jgi:hypothetical protein